MNTEIIFQGTSTKGNEFIIRYLQEGDTQMMLEYINTLSKEKTYITYQGEQLSFEEESKFVTEQLEQIHKKQCIQLLVISKNQIIGTASIRLRDKIESHEGIFGITIHRDFRREGIGESLMKIVLDEAEKQLPKLKIITLNVFGENNIAQRLYRKFGFKEFGRLPEGVFYKDHYIDSVYMYKKIK